MPANPRGLQATARVSEPDGCDRRPGVTVLAISVDSLSVPLGDARLAEGFYAVERACAATPGWRWTNGDAVLRLGAADVARTVRLDVGALITRAAA